MTNKLTPEQIKSWRFALIGMFGGYAFIMPEEDIEKIRDNMQSRFDVMRQNWQVKIKKYGNNLQWNEIDFECENTKVWSLEEVTDFYKRFLKNHREIKSIRINAKDNPENVHIILREKND